MNVTMIRFILFYALVYMGNAVYGTYIPVYFQSIGCSPAQIGALLSLGPLVAILAQPVWGTIGDRSETKNKVLLLLLVGSAVSSLFMPLSSQFLYLLLVICVITFFQTSIFAISDAITLEELEKHKKWSFGPIRMGGTVGFAIMSLLFGLIAGKHISLLFPVYAFVLLAAGALLLRFPKVRGYQSIGRKMQIWELFRHKKLMLYMSVYFVLQMTFGYYYSFFPIYFKGLGGDSLLLGWSMVISSMSEIPFLLLSGKLLRKVPIGYILLGSAAATVLRWLAFYYVTSPYAALPVQALHGLMFIVITVTMATYINKEVPKELRASGQTLSGLVGLGAARIVGSFLGGIAIEWTDMRTVFLYNAIIALACVVVFGAYLLLNRQGSQAQPAGNGQ